jgi:hypothetical protein
MRMRARDVRQARQYAGAVLVLVIVVVLVTVTMGVSVIVAVTVVVVRAARAVHDIQHAPVNALQHINSYQGRALAN